MDHSGKTAIVMGVPSGNGISFKTPGDGVRIPLAGTRLEAFG
jgi:hypothetical protein